MAMLNNDIRATSWKHEYITRCLMYCNAFRFSKSHDKVLSSMESIKLVCFDFLLIYGTWVSYVLFYLLERVDGEPVCTTNIPAGGNVIEDQYYTIECLIGYRGNAAPQMTWTGPDAEWGVWGQASTRTNVSVWSGVNMNMTRYFDFHTFSVLVNFTEQGFILPNSATNVPQWNFTWSTAPLSVRCESVVIT